MIGVAQQPFSFQDVALGRNSSGGGGVVFDVTNYANLLTSYRADGAIVNQNSTVTNIPDYGPNAWHATNVSANTGTFLSNNFLNGHAMFRTQTGAAFNSTRFTNFGRCEIWITCILIKPDTDHITVVGASANKTTVNWYSETTLAAEQNGVGNPNIKIATNAYYVAQLIYSDDPADAGIVTNGVRAIRGSTTGGANCTTSTTMTNINLFSQFDVAGLLGVAEIDFFTDTNSAAKRTEIFQGLGGKFGIAVP